MAEIVKLKDGTEELYPVTVGRAVMLEHGTLQDEFDAKQDKLVSGTNIKTINNEPIIGEGNITIDAPDNVALISDDLSVDSTTHIQASEIEYGSTNVANALNTMRTTTRTYLLSPTGWNDGVYTIESEFITLESTQDILPTVDILPDQLEALQGANIIDGGQTNGKLYLRAVGDIPLIELPIRIVFRGELVGSTLQDASTVSGNVVPFSFGIDADGNYGYIKAGADSVTPFSNFETLWEISDNSTNRYAMTPYDCTGLCLILGVTTNYPATLSINGESKDLTDNINIGSSSSGWGLSARYYNDKVDRNSLLNITVTRNYGCCLVYKNDKTVIDVITETTNTTITTVLKRDCKRITVCGGAKSSYYSAFSVAGVEYPMYINNAGGQTTDSTTGWGLSILLIYGDFKKNQTFSFVRQNNAFGAVIIY